MNHFELMISYKGSKYFGWQVQPDQNTVQGELNKALSKLCINKKFRTLGSGRTDAGVHALGQICKVSMEMNIETFSLMRALNTFLPKDIRIIGAKDSSEKFMPTVDAKSKQYIYLFSNQEVISPIAHDFIVNSNFKLDMKLMKNACRLFIGEHDFHNFQTTGTDVKSTVRTVTFCDITEVADSPIFPMHFQLTIEGSGFLKQMVRLIMGAIWEVGRGKTELNEIKNALSTDNKVRVGPVAPSEGLYLSKVEY